MGLANQKASNADHLVLDQYLVLSHDPIFAYMK